MRNDVVPILPYTISGRCRAIGGAGRTRFVGRKIGIGLSCTDGAGASRSRSEAPQRQAIIGEDPVPNGIPGMLDESRGDDRVAFDELFALVYRELHARARRQRRRWQGNYTLDTTALVHETYVKLVAQKRIDVEDRTHFLALASRAMRHILCNYARAAGAGKRGGDLEGLSLDPMRVPAAPDPWTEEPSEALVALDHALRRLEEVDPRQSRVVECRFFGGLTIEETAATLDISPRTVKRDWQVAQAWLHREITDAG